MMCVRINIFLKVYRLNNSLSYQVDVFSQWSGQIIFRINLKILDVLFLALRISISYRLIGAENEIPIIIFIASFIMQRIRLRNA